MSEGESFYQTLQRYVKMYPRLSWQSESSGEKLEAVRLSVLDVLLWRSEAGNQAEKRLIEQKNIGLPYIGWEPMVKLFDSVPYRLISFKRKTKNPALFDLYIVVPYGWYFVGIKTTLIDT